MKQFKCGDVVPGCKKVFQAETEEQILGQVAAHARNDHGMTEVPATLADAVRSHITNVSA